MRTLHAPLFTFMLCTLLAGCKKDDPTPPPSGGPDDPPVPTPFEMDINGPIGMQMTIGDSTVLYVSGGVYAHAYAVHHVSGGRDYSAGLVGGTNDDMLAGIRLGTIAVAEGEPVWANDFEAFLAPGARVIMNSNMAVPWASIMHRDLEGTEWSTQCGIGAQPSASFEILEMQPQEDEKGDFVRIKATFNCTLYNCSTGEAATVTNGGLVLLLGNF